MPAVDTIVADITAQVISGIEAGAGTWEMPWHKALPIPANAATGREYSGVNVLVLWLQADRCEFASSKWATFKQWKSLDAHVRKGEKGTSILVPIMREEKTPNLFGEPWQAMHLAGFTARTVFNAAQVENFTSEESARLSDVERNAATDAFVAATAAHVVHCGDKASFVYTADEIRMPSRSRFKPTQHSTATEAYYSTLLHELTHWSGHASRLKREFGAFGSEIYAREELVAELGAAFLCAALAITPSLREDHVAYIDSWLGILRKDVKAIMVASAAAARAVRYLEKLQPQ
jgi:antirestriction protein ArdC